MADIQVLQQACEQLNQEIETLSQSMETLHAVSGDRTSGLYQGPSSHWNLLTHV